PAAAPGAYSVAVSRRKLAAILLAQGKPEAAVAELTAGAAGVERLIALEPASATYLEEAADTYIALADAQLAAHDPAEPAISRAIDLAQSLASRDPRHLKWRMQLGQARLLRIRAADASARSPDARRAALAPAEAEAGELLTLASSEPSDRALAATAAEAALLAGDAAAAADRSVQAQAVWSKGETVLAAAQAAGADPLDAESQALIVELRMRRG